MAPWIGRLGRAARLYLILGRHRVNGARPSGVEEYSETIDRKGGIAVAWSWLWVLILGVLIAVGGLAAARFSAGTAAFRLRPSPRTLASAVLLPLLAFLLCLPSRYPFAAGLGLGKGALLGLVAALLALVVIWLAAPRAEHRASLTSTSAALGGLALLWVAATELLFALRPRLRPPGRTGRNPPHSPPHAVAGAYRTRTFPARDLRPHRAPGRAGFPPCALALFQRRLSPDLGASRVGTGGRIAGGDRGGIDRRDGAGWPGGAAPSERSCSASGLVRGERPVPCPRAIPGR